MQEFWGQWRDSQLKGENKTRSKLFIRQTHLPEPLSSVLKYYQLLRNHFDSWCCEATESSNNASKRGISNHSGSRDLSRDSVHSITVQHLLLWKAFMICKLQVSKSILKSFRLGSNHVPLPCLSLCTSNLQDWLFSLKKKIKKIKKPQAQLFPFIYLDLNISVCKDIYWADHSLQSLPVWAKYQPLRDECLIPHIKWGKLYQ